jgi:hypothetical protein
METNQPKLACKQAERLDPVTWRSTKAFVSARRALAPVVYCGIQKTLWPKFITLSFTVRRLEILQTIFAHRQAHLVKIHHLELLQDASKG